MAFFALGDVIAAALYETGKFTHANSVYVWGIIAGSAVGLLASTLGRLYASTYYALRDTRTPLRYAIVRVVLTVGLGYLCAIPLPRWIGIDPHWGAAGLDRVGGRRRMGGVLPAAPLAQSRGSAPPACRLSFVARLWCSAAIGAAAAWGVKLSIVDGSRG